MHDLFGHPISESEMLTKKKPRPGRPWKGGYAAHPGSGPASERCNTCAHYCRVGGGRRAYPKCGLMEHAWTHGPGSDIRAKAPACNRWQAAHIEKVEL